jgi:hypothetical protein
MLFASAFAGVRQSHAPATDRVMLAARELVMVAVMGAIIVGWFTSWVAAVVGYAAFVIYSYVRSRMWVNDPIVALSIATGEFPRSQHIECCNKVEMSRFLQS